MGKAKNVKEQVEQVLENQTENLNIEERLKKDNLLDESIVELGEIKEEEEKKEKKVREYLRAKNKALYFIDCVLLSHAQNRREQHVLNDSIKKAAQFLEDLKASKITPNEFDDKWEEIAKEKRDKFSEITKWYDKSMEELRSKYPNYWSNDWELQRLGLIAHRR